MAKTTDRTRQAPGAVAKKYASARAASRSDPQPEVLQESVRGAGQASIATARCEPDAQRNRCAITAGARRVQQVCLARTKS